MNFKFYHSNSSSIQNVVENNFIKMNERIYLVLYRKSEGFYEFKPDFRKTKEVITLTLFDTEMFEKSHHKFYSDSSEQLERFVCVGITSRSWELKPYNVGDILFGENDSVYVVVSKDKFLTQFKSIRSEGMIIFDHGANPGLAFKVLSSDQSLMLSSRE